MKTSSSKLRGLIPACAAIVVIAAAGCSTNPSREEIGTVTGAVVGGVAGSALTGGSTAGTIGGAVGGGYVGNRLGKDMDQRRR